MLGWERVGLWTAYGMYCTYSSVRGESLYIYLFWLDTVRARIIVVEPFHARTFLYCFRARSTHTDTNSGSENIKCTQQVESSICLLFSFSPSSPPPPFSAQYIMVLRKTLRSRSISKDVNLCLFPIWVSLVIYFNFSSSFYAVHLYYLTHLCVVKQSHMNVSFGL